MNLHTFFINLWDSFLLNNKIWNLPNLDYDVNRNNAKIIIKEVSPVLIYYQIYKKRSLDVIYPLKFLIAKANFCLKHNRNAFPVFFEVLDYYKNKKNKEREDWLMIKKIVETIAESFLSLDKIDLYGKTYYEAYKFSYGHLKGFFGFKLADYFLNKKLSNDKAEKYFKETYSYLIDFINIEETNEVFITSKFLFGYCLKLRNNADKEAFEIFKELIYDKNSHFISKSINHKLIIEVEVFIERYIKENNLTQEQNHNVLSFYKNCVEIKTN